MDPAASVASANVKTATRTDTTAMPIVGTATIVRTGTAMAASLHRSMRPARDGAVASNSGASSADTAIHASDADTCAAMTTTATAIAMPSGKVWLLCKSITATGRV